MQVTYETHDNTVLTFEVLYVGMILISDITDRAVIHSLQISCTFAFRFR